MNIRLRGTPADLTNTLTALAKVLTITHISRTYPDRPPSTTARIYLTAEPSQQEGNDR